MLIFSGRFFPNLISSTVASKRSSWARSARSIVQTTLKWLSSSRIASGSLSGGTITGIIMYPYFLPLCVAVRITRPTDCTTSISEFRAERKRTASRAGTSTPSDRQRTFVSMRHSRSPLFSDFSQDNFSERSVAFIVPSMWSADISTISARSD